MNKNIWGYRIDIKQAQFFFDELMEGRLRQGWGYDISQDLRNAVLEKDTKRNRRMFNKVKKGDIVLIPHLPNRGEVSFVEATEDWDKLYRFDIDKKMGDYGHIFPAKYLKKVNRNSNLISNNIRSTLRNQSRFWNIKHQYSNDIDKLLNAGI